MADEQTSQSPPRRPRRWLWVLAALALLVGSFACYRGVLSYRVSARQAELREAGVLFTPAKLIDVYGPQSAGDDNAAIVYMQAFAAYADVPPAVEEYLPPMSSKAKYPALGQPYPDEHLAAMRTCLDLNQQPRQLLREASALQYARYPVEGLTDGSLQTHFLRGSIEVQQLLLYDARLCVESGDLSGATDAFVDLFALIRSLDTVPNFVSQTVRIMFVNNAVDGCADAINRTAFDEQSLERLQRAMESVDQTIGPACLGVRSYFTTFDNAIDEPFDEWMQKWPGISNNGLMVRGWLGLNALDHLKLYSLSEKIDSVFVLPEQSIWQTINDIDRDDANLPSGYILARGWTNGGIGLIRGKLREIARLRALTCVVAVERFRVEEGQLPANLDVLTPKYLASVPADPYDGKPLKYRTTDVGYLVYSIGRNVVDDGGDSSAVGTTGIALDEVLAITR